MVVGIAGGVKHSLERAAVRRWGLVWAGLRTEEKEMPVMEEMVIWGWEQMWATY